jgi:alkylation response protein AidB-like acyl-CoA dehydrogenase
MDFDDTPEEAAFRAEARAWLGANAELRGETDEDSSPLREVENADAVQSAQRWQALKADARWACIGWPPEYGGRGASPIQSVIWGQEEARYHTPPNVFAIGQGMLGPTIMAHGTPEQKQRYLHKMLRGEEIWCQLFSEPSAGSDLAGLRTSAVRDGDHWILNGQKIWTTGAHYSHFGMVLTRTDMAAPKHAGITYFIVDMRAPGVEVRPIRQMNGGSGFNEVFFSDVRVSDQSRVGAVNDGWRGAITTLMNERALIASLGGSGPGLDDLVELARRVPRAGGKAIDDPAVRQRLADFHVRLSGLRYTNYRTLTAFSRGQTPGPESSISKLVGAALSQEMAGYALELLGAAGAADDPTGGFAQWSQAYLYAPGMRLAGGSDEILRNIIAERVLRLPAEIRVDKDVPFSALPGGRR